MNEATWGRLLGQIADRKVVPVVGTQLVDGVGGERGLQRALALELVQRYTSDFDPARLTPGAELNAAVSWLKDQPRVRLQRLYDEVNELLETMTADASRMPAALEQVAAITHFDLLVTATPDGLLERCLAARGDTPRVLIHSPNADEAAADHADLPLEYKPGAQRWLLYLFGKRRYGPEFAIHDEDVLEYAHNLIAGGVNVPERFLGALRHRSLLFLGCRFPDWLARFLVRTTNKDRLSVGRSKREWIVEPLPPESALTLFLQNHSADTELLSDMAPEAFVAELHRRWTERYGAAPAATGAPAPAPASASDPHFFVSYSRTDSAAAEALVQALRGLGVAADAVWFDRDELRPGDGFDQRIRHAIATCRYFVPLLSTAVAEREEAYVFGEWRLANERRTQMARPFVLPLIVDERYDPLRFTRTTYLPSAEWAAIDFGHAPGGVPDERTLALLRERVRDIARGRSGA